jgi:hypothetical protein
MYVMEYSSFMHALVTRFRAKLVHSVVEQMECTFAKPHEVVTIVPSITNNIVPPLYFTDPCRLFLEADNYSKFVHIFTHILLISTPIHTGKQTYLAPCRLVSKSLSHFYAVLYWTRNLKHGNWLNNHPRKQILKLLHFCWFCNNYYFGTSPSNCNVTYFGVRVSPFLFLFSHFTSTYIQYLIDPLLPLSSQFMV